MELWEAGENCLPNWLCLPVTGTGARQDLVTWKALSFKEIF